MDGLQQQKSATKKLKYFANLGSDAEEFTAFLHLEAYGLVAICSHCHRCRLFQFNSIFRVFQQLLSSFNEAAECFFPAQAAGLNEMFWES